jgi:hypothetical protein
VRKIKSMKNVNAPEDYTTLTTKSIYVRKRYCSEGEH